jgi:hypothetical protein
MARSEKVKLPVVGTEITFNAPTVGVVRSAMEANKTEIGQEIAIISKCCNMTEKELEALEMKDYASLQAVLKSFLADAGV